MCYLLNNTCTMCSSQISVKMDLCTYINCMKVCVDNNALVKNGTSNLTYSGNVYAMGNKVRDVKGAG
jgi:hypothetical protein